jgi:mono/diheme cytochrome c family protein
MLPAAMRVRRLISLLAVPAAMALAGCGEEAIELSKSDPLYKGAEIFNQRCGGCHTFDSAGTEGSASKANDSERKDGPNFNIRKEQYPDVLYAIENGGFSSGPMPQNIVTGDEAKYVACFVATYSGKDASQDPSPGSATNTPKSTGDCKQELASR